MRQETQPWNSIRINLEIVDEGVGQTGLTVEATLRRSSDGQYLQSGGGWGASPSTLTLGQPSAANLPGHYRYSTDPDDFSTTDGIYIAKITESTYSILEYVEIVPTLSANDLLRMLALRQDNTKFKPTAWDATSKQPTAGTVWIYPDAATHDADTTPNGTGAIGSYTVAATFSSGQLTLYSSKRSS